MRRAGRTQAGSCSRPRTRRTRRPPGRRGIRWGRPGDEGAGTGAGSAGLLLLVDTVPGCRDERGHEGASREWSDERAVGRKTQARRTAKRSTAATALAAVTARRSQPSEGPDQCLHREETQRGQGQAEDEEAGPHGDQAAPMGLSLHAVGQFPVHGEVEEGADGQGERVGPEGTGEWAPGHEEKEVAEGADGAHAGKAQQLVGRHLIDGRPRATGRAAGSAAGPGRGRYATRRAGR